MSSAAEAAKQLSYIFGL